MTKGEFAVNILHQYSEETSNLLRGTSDLSPLEEWLIVKLYYDGLSYSDTEADGYVFCGKCGKQK